MYSNNAMDNTLVFGELARKWRIELNLTQEALAAVVLGNLDRKGYISNMEQGKLSTITPSTVQNILRLICEAFYYKHFRCIQK